MRDILYKVYKLLDKKDRFQVTVLFMIMVFGSFLEVLSIGAIIPYILLIGDPEKIESYPFLQEISDYLGLDSLRELLLVLGGVLIFIFLFKNLYLIISNFLQSKFAYKKYKQISSRLFNTYLEKPYIFHLQRNSAALLRNIQLVQNISQSIILPLLYIASEVIIVMAILALLFTVDVLSTVIVIVTLSFFSSVFYFLIRKKLKKWGNINKHQSAQVIQQVNQGLGGIKETKILGAEKYFSNSFTDHLRRLARVNLYQRVASKFPMYYIEMIIISLIILIMIFHLLLGKSPRSIFASLTLLAMAAVRLMPSAAKIANYLTTVRYHLPGLNEVYNDIANIGKHQKQSESLPDKHLVSGFAHSIKLENISYQYPDSEKTALENISFEIPKNSCVAFVGGSGAGKTTIIDVILGLLEPSEGEIFIDGKKIRNIINSWQHIIGYVPQNIYLSDASVKENIAFGQSLDCIDEKKVINALQLAQFYSYIEKMPEKLNTFVGERGVRLSGGQRQRIGIARALYHEPEILIMDEATAALDNETEHAIMQAIEKLSGKKTIIMIAHRLSTIKNCDTIFYMEDGRLIASDSYNELLEKCPGFYKLAKINEEETL